MFSGRSRRQLTMVVSTVALLVPAANTMADDPPAAIPAPTAAPSIAEAFARLVSDYEAEQQRCNASVEKASTRVEERKIYSEQSPDKAAYSRRAVELALTDVKSLAARDALIWVLDQPGMSEGGSYGDEFGRAVALLVRHHGDDPEVGRKGLELDNLPSPQRDALLQGIYIAAKDRQAKGLARLALGQYLEMKAKLAVGIRMSSTAPSKIRFQTADDRGQLVWQEIDRPVEEQAYLQDLRLVDADSMRRKAQRLYEEIASEYLDVPYVTRSVLSVAKLLEEPEPKWNGKPLSAEQLAQGRAMVDRKRTLAEAAAARLDDMLNLAVGEPAPDIEGTDLTGQPLKLSSYHGRVVVLVFWGSWCGPCMAEVPHEKELAERFKGRPFAVLGVDCMESPEAGRKTADEKGMTWPSWHDGVNEGGPIATLYHVRSFPSVFVIDAQGKIRSRETLGELIGPLLETLVKEAEMKK